MTATVVFLTTTGAGTWTVPAGVTSVQVECLGAGVVGATGGAKGAGLGGDGSGYAKKNALAVTPGASIAYQVGAPSGFAAVFASWFNGTSTADASAVASITGGVTQVGDETVAGGSRSGQTGGNAAKFSLISWTQTSDSATAAPGAGGVGGAPGTAGGLYGGGGGGGNAGGSLGGNGAQGIIVLTYTAAAVVTPPADTADTHDPGFYPSEALKRLRERIEKNVVERAEDQAALVKDLQRSFGLIEEAAEELSEEHREAVAEAVGPDQGDGIDWSAVASEMARIEAVMLAAERAQAILWQREQARIEAQRQFERNEEDALLLLLAT